MNDIEKAKDRIAKLLRKAEDTGASTAEREAFTEHAERMMLRLGIDIAELESTGDIKPENIVERKLEWRGSYSIAMVQFVADVARGYGNITVLQSGSSDMLRYTFLIGTESDVDQLATLLASLNVQARADLVSWQKEHRARRRYFTDMEKYTENRSFLLGFGQRVSARLRALRTTEEATASTGAALVLASKESRVRAQVELWYPRMRAARGGIQTDSWGARSAGHRAGDRAALGQQELGGRGAIGR